MPEFQTLSFTNFSGGLNESLDQAAIADNEVVAALNLELNNKDEWSTRLGTDRFTNLTAPSPLYFIGSFQKSGGAQYRTLAVANDKVYAGDAGGALSLLGTVPIANPWYWKSMNDLFIGVGGMGANNATFPYMYDGTTLALLGGTPPKGRFLEVWNSRLFIVSSEFPNRIYYCTVGNVQDWTTTGVAGAGFLEIGYNDGDVISAIVADKERLIIFKTNKTYQIITANPNTDPTMWRIELLNADGGCINAGTIQTIDDDIIFMSFYGLQSLRRVQLLGDFEKASLSKNLNFRNEIAFLSTGPWNIAFASAPKSLYLSEKKQYIMSFQGVPQYVMQKNSKGEYVWSTFEFLCAGSGHNGFPAGIIRYYGKNRAVFTNNLVSSYGCANIVYPKPFAVDTEFQSYASEDYFKDDNGSPEGSMVYQWRLITKQYPLNTGFIRNKLNKIAVMVRNIGYYFDSEFIFLVSIVKQQEEGAKTAFLETLKFSGGILGGLEKIVGNLAVFWRRIFRGKNARTIQFHAVSGSTSLNNAEATISPIIIKGFAAQVMPTNERRAGDL